MKKLGGFLFFVLIIVGVLYFLGIFDPPVSNGLPDLNKTVFINGEFNNDGKMTDFKLNINNDNTATFEYAHSEGFVGKWNLYSKNDEMIKLNVISGSTPDNLMVTFYKNSEVSIALSSGNNVISGKWRQ